MPAHTPDDELIRRLPSLGGWRDLAQLLIPLLADEPGYAALDAVFRETLDEKGGAPAAVPLLDRRRQGERLLCQLAGH